MKNIPTQAENPNGLHSRYYIKKIVRNPKAGKITGYDFFDQPIREPDFIAVSTDENAEYFVMRLDTGGSDIEHIKACRIGVHAYADAIQHHLPELAKDLKERYPLI